MRQSLGEGQAKAFLDALCQETAPPSDSMATASLVDDEAEEDPTEDGPPKGKRRTVRSATSPAIFLNIAISSQIGVMFNAT